MLNGGNHSARSTAWLKKATLNPMSEYVEYLHEVFGQFGRIHHEITIIMAYCLESWVGCYKDEEWQVCALYGSN